MQASQSSRTMTINAPAADSLLSIVRQIYQDVHRRAPHNTPIHLRSRFDRDLGLDSLARVELLLRVEKAFAVHIPDAVLESAGTPEQLLQALGDAQQLKLPSNAAVIEAPRLEEDSSGMPDGLTTLPEALDWHVQRHPQRTQIIYSDDLTVDADVTEITYGQLAERAEAVAAGLQSRGIEPRQTVAIMLPTGPDYFYAYFGILLAGAIPVPIYPPARLSQIEDHVSRHCGILANAEAAILITVPEARAVARMLQAHVQSLRHIVTADELQKAKHAHVRVPVQGSDIAFIQYTSGSTGNPKGVALTHENLLANIHSIGEGIGINSNDVFVSWLPLYHDFGLIAAWLASLCYGNRLVVMSPLAFLLRPERWLWAIHRYRGTLTAAPNFAYDLACKRIEDAQLEGLDLSCLRLAANAAEPISPDTVTRFTDRFSAYGFKPEAMVPAYGLAEATVGVAVDPLDRAPRIDHIQRETFTNRGIATPAADNDEHALRFVACGRPLPNMQVRVVDGQGEPVAERAEGMLEFRGPSATQGYFRNPGQSKDLFHDGWVVTGDRAYLADGEIFLTGRVKDIIIRAGRNIYPHELEEAVGNIDGIRRGCVAVFGSADPQTGTERLIVLAETRVSDADERAALCEQVRALGVDLLGAPPDEVVLAPPQTVLKTSSGKIRRAACRERFEQGQASLAPRAGWRQLFRLGREALWPQIKHRLSAARAAVYGVYVWALLLLVSLPTWLLVAITPRPGWAWQIARLSARCLLRLSGVSLTVRGLEHLPQTGSCVLIANHASYIDGLVLLAALPRQYSFVAKQELESYFIPRVFLRRLGVEFVERFAVRQSVQHTERMVAAVKAGRSLVVFPEGTFLPAVGLLPFRLGAFVAAVQAQVPVVPLAIKGARHMLRAGQWSPKRGGVQVSIGKPIEATVSDTQKSFAAAIALRDEAREEILRHCGEPDMA